MEREASLRAQLTARDDQLVAGEARILSLEQELQVCTSIVLPLACCPNHGNKGSC